MLNIPFPDLLTQLVDCGSKPIKYRIKRIYDECLINNHLKWAEAIKRKYPEAFRVSDLAMAFYMSQSAQTNNHNK